MFNAINEKGIKVNISNASKLEKYYCPICGSELIIKKGEINTHHFSHIKYANCDAWYNDMSLWHQKWQSMFDIENQEVIITKRGVSHIADVMIDNTILEFQHSSISKKEFNERNEFYLKTAKKVIWVIDCYGKEIEYTNIRNIHKDSIKWIRLNSTSRIMAEHYFYWKYRKRVFFDENILRNRRIEIYLHYNDDLIIKIEQLSYYKYFIGNAMDMFTFLKSLKINLNHELYYNNFFEGYVEYYGRLYNCNEIKKWIHDDCKNSKELKYMAKKTKELLRQYLNGLVSYEDIKYDFFIKEASEPKFKDYYFSKYKSL